MHTDINNKGIPRETVYTMECHNKAKAKDDFSNYRPISLLPTLSNVLEKVVHKRVYSFLTQNEIVCNHQYGFRRKHSTIDAITKFVTDATSSLDDKDSVFVWTFLRHLIP